MFTFTHSQASHAHTHTPHASANRPLGSIPRTMNDANLTLPWSLCVISHCRISKEMSKAIASFRQPLFLIKVLPDTYIYIYICIYIYIYIYYMCVCTYIIHKFSPAALFKSLARYLLRSIRHHTPAYVSPHQHNKSLARYLLLILRAQNLLADSPAPKYIHIHQEELDASEDAGG
jgi:hypothetical protein